MASISSISRNAADRQLIRAINRAMVLNAVREAGPLSKADVARMTGLSQATVGAIVRSLIERGLLTEGQPTAAGVGRPPTLVQLDLDSYNVIGLKVMSDHIVGAVTDLEARTLAQHEVGLNDTNPESVVDAAATTVESLVRASRLKQSRLLGMGIGIPGVIDTARGLCVRSPFLGWSNVPIAALIEARISMPVRVDNDVNTLALAERWFGSGQKADDFLLVTLGRGVGLSIVAASRVYRGAHGGAGELGHTVNGNRDVKCTCGNTGCLEASIAEPALLSRARELATEHGFTPPESARELYDTASDSDQLSALLTDAGRQLGQALGNLVNLFAPSMVILSGEGVDAGPLLIDPARDELAAHVHEGLRSSYELIVEPLSDDTWARGAASLILDAIFDPPTHPEAAPMWEWEVD